MSWPAANNRRFVPKRWKKTEHQEKFTLYIVSENRSTNATTIAKTRVESLRFKLLRPILVEPKLLFLELLVFELLLSELLLLELLPLDLFRLGLLRLELVGLEAVVHEQGPLQRGDPVADQVATLHLGGNSMKPSSAHSGLPATAVAPPSGSCRGSLSRTS